MKKQTPMQMRKKETGNGQPKKAAAKHDQRPKSAMERYAQERMASMKAAAVPDLAMYDPQTDLHHMQKAAEVHANPSRRRAAHAEAKKKIKALTKVLK